MSRWLVKLEGDRFDLEEYPYWFPQGDAYAITLDEDVYITGTAFDKFTSAAQVKDSAVQILDEFSSVISMLSPGIRRPKIDHIVYEEENGTRQVHHILSVEPMVMRSKLRATLSLGEGGLDSCRGPTQAEQLLSASRQDRRLQLIVSIWADPVRTWPRLYRLLEELEAFLGTPVDTASFCTEAERGRFTRSANSAEIAGKDSRHRGGKFTPPKNPMSLNEAVAFIRALIIKALRQAGSSCRHNNLP